MRRGPFGSAILMSCLIASPAFAAGRGVSFRAEDGRTINAVVFEPSQRPAPAVVLVPMLGRPKDDWDAVGQRLADANILALAIDLPGASDPGDSKILGAWSADVRASVSYLSARPDVRPGSVGLAGASLGASLAALAAADLPAVRSLVLSALLMASSHDPYAARTVRELAKDPPGTRETRVSETTAHGTVLLARDPDLVRTLVEWFQATLAR